MEKPIAPRTGTHSVYLDETTIKLIKNYQLMRHSKGIRLSKSATICEIIRISADKGILAI